MKRLVSILLIIQLLLTGCWDNQEFEESAFVQGVGLDKIGDKLKVYVEITKPSGGQEGGSAGQSGGQHIILDIKADSLIEAFRGLIRTAKRRLDFTHTQIFIISEKLARETNFPLELGFIRRDTMIRLNNYLFISDKNPGEILNTPTLYQSLTSNELASVIQQTKFITEYIPTYNYEFYRFLEEHHSNAYIPIISLRTAGKQKVTAIIGTAVIKGNKMIGKLNIKESAGLNWLLNQVKGGSVTVKLKESERVSIEVKTAKTKVKPRMDGNQLIVDIQTSVVGTLADDITNKSLDRGFFKESERYIASEVEELMLASIKKLQLLQTDITSFGQKLHQKNPKEWKSVESDWNHIFANARVNIDVEVNINHQGLINEAVHSEEEGPDQNPYRFIKSFFGR